MSENKNNEVEQNEELDVNHLMQIRRDKLKELQDAGKNPFEITKYDRTNTAGEIKAKYEEFEQKDVKVAGRIIAKRIMGKASFCTIQDCDEKIQSYVSINDLGEESYKEFKTYDIGDIIGISGFVFKTRTEEISVHAKEVVLLSKSLRPLPEKFHGLKDTDLRYRQRYVDLIVNPEVKDTFILRSKILKEIRKFMDEYGYMEVETPMLTTVATGDAARPFITHHNTLDLQMYLRIAPELNLKRLIVGGIDKVFEIGKNFRNEGMDIKHNPEFTTVELYEAYGDLQSMRGICGGIMTSTCQEVLVTTKIAYLDKEIDFTPEFRWVSMSELVKEKTGVDFTSNITLEEAQELVSKYGIKIEKHWTSTGYYLNALFEELCEEDLIQPTFVYGHPIEISPLTKKGKDPRFTESFELYINATDSTNAYSESTDPIDQK